MSRRSESTEREYTIQQLLELLRGDRQIEEAKPRYTKEALLKELRRRRIHGITSRTISFYISRGWIDPPLRQDGKRGRPGLYNGSTVIIFDLVRCARSKRITPLFLKLKENMASLKKEATTKSGRSEKDSLIRPLHPEIDKEFSQLIRNHSREIIREASERETCVQARYEVKNAIDNVVGSIGVMNRSILSLQTFDERLCKD